MVDDILAFDVRGVTPGGPQIKSKIDRGSPVAETDELLVELNKVELNEVVLNWVVLLSSTAAVGGLIVVVVSMVCLLLINKYLSTTSQMST